MTTTVPWMDLQEYRIGEAVVACPPGDHVARRLERGRYYEIDLLEALAERYSSGTIIDVGAHVGNHTAYFACELGANVIAVEAYEPSFVALRRTVEVSGITEQVECIHAAVDHEWTSAHVLPGPDGNSGMAQARQGGSLRVVRLDDLAPISAPPIAIVKIDVEGNAARVLLSGLNMIRLNRPVLAVEARTLDEEAETAKILKAFGYQRSAQPYASTPVWVWT